MLHNPYQIAEIKLSFKNKPDLSSRPKITQSKDAYVILLNAWDDEQIGFVEEFKILLLNRANFVLGIYHLSKGGVSGVNIDPKLVFAAALQANASNIILAHNHPSESTAPSKADKDMTQKLKEAGEALEITVLDHLIVSPQSYYSFADDASYNRKDLNFTDLEQEPSVNQQKVFAAEENLMSSSPAQSFYNDVILKGFAGRQIARSEAAYDLLISTWGAHILDRQRTFKLLCLDENCRALTQRTLPQGMSVGNYTDAQTILTMAAKENARFIVLAQNKNYGVILPKMADLDFTDMLISAGKDHDILLLDYLFVNQNGYYSYNDNEFRLHAKLQPL